MLFIGFVSFIKLIKSILFVENGIAVISKLKSQVHAAVINDKKKEKEKIDILQKESIILLLLLKHLPRDN